MLVGRNLEYMEDVFFSRNRVFKIGPMRGVYFVTFAVFFVHTEIGREIYRPYVYQNGLNDFGLADVIGNLLGTVAIIFFLSGDESRQPGAERSYHRVRHGGDNDL